MQNNLNAWVEINLSAVENNTRFMKKMCGTALMAVVKSNAYGHGMVEIAKTVMQAGADLLGVTKIVDGIELRREGITAPIFILGGVFPNEIDDALNFNLTLPLMDRKIARILSERGHMRGKDIPVHLAIDTGLGRFGIFPDEVTEFVTWLLDLGGVELEGIYTHFSMADVKDHPLNDTQYNHFMNALNQLDKLNVHPKWIHAASSAGSFYLPETRFNLVRIGEAILGTGTGSDDFPYPEGLRRTFAWKTRLVSVRKFPAGWPISYGHKYYTSEGEWIGVVPVGHGDGFRRAENNAVIINGKRLPVVGKVCIDQFMVSLPEEYETGTEVILIGKQGDAEITPEEIRDRWQVALTNVGLVERRTPRVYIRDNE